MIEPLNHDLAIVVPAFKPDFLGRTLESIRDQTDQQFHLYVCDDASPADIKSIADSVLGSRSYSFKRFDRNLGGTSIAKHWDRCLDLVKEPWVWFFSDDDVMHPLCVEAFHELVTSGSDADVARFDGWIIDEADKVIEPFPTNFDKESWLEFAYGCLMNWRRAFLQQIIFRTSSLRRTGFLDLPMGWTADYAAIISAARERPVRRIAHGCVYWRRSNKNAAPDVSLRARKKKLRATCLFLGWLKGALKGPREHLFGGDDRAFVQAMDRHLVEGIMTQGFVAAISNLKLLLRTRAKVCEASRVALAKYVAVTGLRDTISGLVNVVRAVAEKFAT